jgi:hypothetical protein
MQVKDWFRKFREGWTSVKSDEHSGRPSISNKQLMTDKGYAAMLDNWRMIIRELSN